MAKKRIYYNGKIVEVDEDLFNSRNYENMMAPIYSQNEQLSPIDQQKEKKEKQWYETIIEKPKAFDDGYQFGDVTGTVLGSTADAGLNALEGIFRVGEGIAMAGAGLLVEGIDAFAGENEYTKGVRRRIAGEDGAPPLTRLTQWLEDQISDYSIFGQTGDEVWSGIGYTYGMLEGGKALPGGGNVELAVGGHVARLPVLSAVGGASSGFQTAYQQGATGTQAIAKAMGSGAIESVTESMFGFMGIGGNDITDEFAKKFTGQFTNGVAQHLAKVGISASAEGFEEVMSSTANQFLDKMIDKYSGENDPKFYQKLNPEELAQEFVTTFLSTAITGGYDSVTNINHLTNNAISNFEQETGRTLTVAEKTQIRDQVTRALANENTLNEQQVIDKEMENRLAELGEYTRADRNRIRNEINQDLENGRISIDTIENTLPGISDQWNAQFNELKELQEEIKSSEGAEKDYLIREYQRKLQEYKQDERLRNSYVEEVNKYQQFKTGEMEALSDLAKATYQSAVDSGMNNTKDTHNLVELASKIADYTGVNIKFATNEFFKTVPKIAEKMSDNTIVNGVKIDSENTIYVNKDSKKSLYTILGHEVGHLLDNMDEGIKIRDFARKYADSKGEYNDRYSRLIKNYNQSEISTEMANDIIGEYLFTDENFVTQLATEHPSTFKKIYNWFQHIFNLAKAGSKEARQLEQVRYNLEKGLDKIKNTNKSVEKSGEKEYNILASEEGALKLFSDKKYGTALMNKFYNALSKKQWNQVLKDIKSGKLELNENTAVGERYDDKIVFLQIKHGKPQVVSVYEVNKFAENLIKEKYNITEEEFENIIYEELEKEGYNEREIKKFSKKFGTTSLFNRYDTKSHTFTNTDGRNGKSNGRIDNGNRTDSQREGILSGTREDGGKISTSLSNKYEGRFADGTDAQLQQAKKNLEFNINRLTETVASQEEGNKISKGSFDEQLAINRDSLKELKLQYEELKNEFKKRGKDVSFSLDESKIQGLEDYTRDEIKDIAKDYIKTALLYSDVDADIKDMEIIGSRNRGTANEDSDLDIVVELDGEDLREDNLFNVLNDDEEPLIIDGVRVDFNPIVSYRSGTLEEFMERSNAYDQEVLNKSDNSLTKQLEKNLEKRLFNAEYERQGMIDIFNSYLEENGIENPTQEDINNSLDAYDLMDANEDGTPISAIEEKYDRTIKEYLKEKGITLEKEIAPVNNDMISRKKDGTLQIKQEDIKATDEDLEKIFGKQINEEYDEAMEEAEKIKWSLDSEGNELSEEQQKFFNESKIRDADGKLSVMYHGTPYGGFTVFNHNNNGSGGDSGYFGYGYYFTDNKQLANTYSDADFIDADERTTVPGEYGNVEVKEVYLNAKNPYMVDGTKVEYEDGALEKLLGTNSPYESTQKLQDQGYDAVVYTGKDGIREVTVFDPNQIKNTNNTNPTENEDIRFSLSTDEQKDNRGKKLSDEQLSYFKDSKIRDSKGRLLRVYHGTDNGDFTIFDADKVGSNLFPAFGEGFYFDSNKSTSEAYTGKDGIDNIKTVYLNITNPYYASDSEVGMLHKDDLIKQGYDGVSVYGHEFVAFYPEQIKNIDNTSPTSDKDIRYSISEDSEGRELSKEQRNYFKNSKAIDDNGNLKTVYHTTTEAGEQFNEFNPVGTDHYRFGDQVVNYYTDSQEMSGSYADQLYDKADTTKLNNTEEAIKWIEDNRFNGLQQYDYELKDLKSTEDGKRLVLYDYNDGHVLNALDYLSEEEFLKNVKRDVNRYNSPVENLHNKQYEGYVNITNPYTLDANRRGWNQVTTKQTDELINAYRGLTKEQKAVVKDVMGWEDWGVFKDEVSKYYIAKYVDKQWNERYEKNGYEENLAEVGKMLHDQYTPNAKEGTIALKGYSDLHTIAGNNFTVKAIKKYAGIEQTTNDVVKSVLEQNKNGSNYDGVIIKNVVDYGGDTETRAPANVYVTFNSNQFKSTDNTSPTSDSDIRYSISDDGEMVDEKGKKVKLEASEVGNTNSLMAIHNLNEEKLRGIIDLGGFPVPSIAIVDTNKMTHSEFGDISVLFGKDTIDPSKSKNEVYDRDVWSPTFPQIAYDINNDSLRKMSKANNIYDNYEDSITSHARLNYLYADNLANLVERIGIDNALQQMKEDKELKYVYAKTLDNDYQPQMKPTKYSDSYSNETLQKFIDSFKNDMSLPDYYYHYLNYGDMEISEKELAKLKADIREIISDEVREEALADYEKNKKTIKMAKKDFIDRYMKMALESYDNSYFKYKDFVRDASRLYEFGETDTVDENATLQKVAEDINQEEYEKWIDNTFGELLRNAPKGIRNDTDLFTPMGNQRSFKATHDAYNLQNLVKKLSRGNTKGGQEMSIFGTGFGRISAQLSHRFDSISDIKQNQDRMMTREEAQKIIEPLSDKLYEDTQSLANYYKSTDYKSEYVNNMQAVETASQVVEEFAGKKLTVENFRKILDDYYRFDKNIPDSVLQNIIDDLEQAKNLPTDYFEAKPQRAVGLDEIEAIVLPTNASQDLKDQLDTLGIKYYEYDKSVENAREEAINKFDNIKFSISNEEDIAPTKESYPKSFEPFYEFAQEQGFLDEDEKMMIFNGTDKDKKKGIKDKVTTPREEYKKTPRITPEKSQMKKTIDLLDYMFVNRNSEIDNLARDSGNANIKYLGDMLNGVSGESQNEVLYGQTNNQGERIGKSVNELFEWANANGKIDAFNDYLLHYSNIDRHKNGKGSRVHLETSEKMVRKYEKAHPEFKQHAEEVWNFAKNVRDNLLEAGIINQSTYDYLSEVYPHYVPYMEERDITQYIDDSGKLKPVSAIKTAKGGATHSNLTPVQEALTKYIYSEKKSIRQNDLYREIYNTLDGEKMLVGADDRSNPVETGTGLYRDENGSFLTAYFDGELNAIRISDDLYNQLDRRLERQVRDIEQNLSLITKPLQVMSNVRRNLLTTWSPSFLVKNPIKDFGDALINSTDTKAFIKNYLPAYGELMSETELAKQFKALYGSGNAMGEYESESGLSTGKKAIQKGKGMLQRIANFNEIVELAPRFAEFKATLERGGSVQEAMYNAREVTINFNRGGVITKAMNRNGFTFLNASVQGFDKFIRNFSGQNGAMGVVGALLKATTFGVMPALFNHLIYAGGDDPDEDYEALPDYIKDNYYLIKTDNGTFIRIPKGRIPAVFGMVGRRTLEYAQGEEDAFEGMGESIYDQIGFDPFNNHVFAPIQQAYFSGENGRAWYGGDLVPTRLQDKPAGEQYDESTDAVSKWIGSQFGISPYKLNYVIDQYTGGMGDIFLPMITEEASSDAETLPEYMIAPIKDQFIVDSTMDNKYAGEFYQTKEDYTIKSNSAYATDEDILKEKYLYSVSSELSKLYQEKREIQSDPTLSKKQKYEKVRLIQDEINKLAKEGLEGYNQLSKTDNYAIVGDREYYKDGDEWKKMSDKELDMLNSLGLDLNEKASYIDSKSQISNIKEEYDEELEDATEEEKTLLNRQKKLDIINTIKNSNLTDEAKAYLYTRSYGDYATVNALNELGISMNDYLDLESQEFTADKYANGKTVPNSKKNKTLKYINSMNITMEQKIILAKIKYPSIKTYNNQIIRYIQNNRYLDYDEKKLLLDKMGFKVEDNKISW